MNIKENSYFNKRFGKIKDWFKYYKDEYVCGRTKALTNKNM